MKLNNIFKDVDFLGLESFKVQEFVPKEVFDAMGSHAIHLIDFKIIRIACYLRTHFNAPIIINTWHYGGTLQERGYRLPTSTTGAKGSQHKYGKAIDFNVQGIPSDHVNEIIRNNPGFYNIGIRRIENYNNTPTWTHIDIKPTEFNFIKVVKPIH